MMWLVLSILVVQPVMDEPGDMRLVATGIEDETVTWRLDGRTVGMSSDREAISVHVGAGTHRVEAETAHADAWQILARPEPRGSGATYVQGWTASYVPESSDEAVWPWEPVAAGLMGLSAIAILFWPTRSKHP